MSPRQPLRRAVLAGVLGLAALACSGDDDDAEPDADDVQQQTARFCDVYLDYLADRSPTQLIDVAAAADDPEVDDLVAVIDSDDATGRIVAATDDLDDLAVERCQAEWVGGAQGAGNTGAAATAFADALTAGDRFGARNVASANAIAVFEPWDPADTVVLSTGEKTFELAVGDDALAQCQVEIGVVVFCTVVRDG